MSADEIDTFNEKSEIRFGEAESEASFRITVKEDVVIFSLKNSGARRVDKIKLPTAVLNDVSKSVFELTKLLKRPKGKTEKAITAAVTAAANAEAKEKKSAAKREGSRRRGKDRDRTSGDNARDEDNNVAVAVGESLLNDGEERSKEGKKKKRNSRNRRSKASDDAAAADTNADADADATTTEAAAAADGIKTKRKRAPRKRRSDRGAETNGNGEAAAAPERRRSREIDPNRAKIKNLPFNFTEDRLRALLSDRKVQFNSILWKEKGRNERSFAGYCFVEFAEAGACQAFIDGFTNVEIDQRKAVALPATALTVVEGVAVTTSE